MIPYIKNHWLKILLITLIFIVFLGHYQYKMPKRNFADFHAYYYTGQRLLNGQDIYDVNGFRKDKMAIFKYPPLFASITALFALTSERVSATIWLLFNFFLIIMFMFYSGKAIFKDKLTPRQRNWVYFWALFLTSRFYMDNFDEGQVNLLMMTTFFLGMYASSKNKDFLGGLLIGFSILIKYMSAIFIPYFILKRKFKLVLYILLSLAMSSLLPALFFGWQKNLLLQGQYLHHLSQTSLDFYSLSDEANQSLLAMIIRFFSSHGFRGVNFINLGDYYLGILTGSSFMLFYILCFLRSKNNKVYNLDGNFNNIDIGLLSICAALFNPNAWMHAFIFLTYGYMIAFFYLFKEKFNDKTVFVLLFLSFVLHSVTNDFLTKSWAGDLFDFYSFVTFGAVLLFIALLKIKFLPNPISD